MIPLYANMGLLQTSESMQLLHGGLSSSLDGWTHVGFYLLSKQEGVLHLAWVNSDSHFSNLLSLKQAGDMGVQRSKQPLVHKLSRG